MADDVVSHEYASQYYDPAKAHEYYLKNRELKGRNPAELNKADKKVWSATKSNIAAEKKSATKNLVETHKTELKQLRDNAQNRKQTIYEKIKSVIEQVQNQQTTARDHAPAERKRRVDAIQAKAKASFEKIIKDAQAKVDALPPLGDNPSKAEVSQRKKLLNSIKKDVKSQVSAITKKADADRKGVLASIPVPSQNSPQAKQLAVQRKAQVAQIGEELKTALTSSKQKYDELRKGLATKYETVYQTEFDKIKGS